MTTYFVTVGANEYKVDVQNEKILVNDEQMDVKIRRLNQQGLFLLQKGNRQLEVVMNPREQNEVSVLLDRKHLTIQVTQSTGPRIRKQASGGALSAPMPGLLLEFRVQPGQLVNHGDVIAVMESMKMQMEIRTPITGVVKKLLVKPGNKVSKGDHLAQIIEA